MTIQFVLNVATVVVIVAMVWTHLRIEWLRRHPDHRKTWLPRIWS